jgi:hypothetical protein
MKKQIVQESIDGFTSKQVYTPEVKVQRRGNSRNNQTQSRSRTSATKHKEQKNFTSDKRSEKNSNRRRRNYV